MGTVDCFQKHFNFGDDPLTKSWTTGQEGKHTWLTDTVSKGLWEVVAILSFHGADPHQTCPQHIMPFTIYSIFDPIESVAFTILDLLYSTMYAHPLPPTPPHHYHCYYQ